MTISFFDYSFEDPDEIRCQHISSGPSYKSEAPTRVMIYHIDPHSLVETICSWDVDVVEALIKELRDFMEVPNDD